MNDSWDNREVGTALRANAGRPLTRSLDLREEGSAMKATRNCSITECDRAHFGKGLCQRHLEQKRRRDRKNGPACVIEGCEAPAEARGWCQGHYRRWLDHGDPMAGRRSPNPGPCSVASCERPKQGRGYCVVHYGRWKRTGDPEGLAAPRPVRLCSIEGCDRIHSARGRCSLHAERWRATGSPTEVQPSARDLKGPLSPNWHGYEITYEGAHTRVRDTRGKARFQVCVDCGNGARHWSYDHADPEELIEPPERGGKHYSAKPEHYQPRCNRCHALFDMHPRGTVKT